MKIAVALAVAVGIIFGVGFAVLQNSQSSGDSTDSSAKINDAEGDPRKDLPIDVLKALPDEELAEIFPEKAEAILNPEAFDQIKTGGSKSDDPEYLRAVLQKMGVSAPDGATTAELQELVANAESSYAESGK
ncbi:hypothetical protein [Candidatus Lucifugimonas marina]|uniref:Uncharacterized protein n=1 Tax=Candidatus Lucifugimonas marina TaxID=3038979 RepID=A0AAJ5ZE25_9CHLR|nr:hypothetical protein [SAR202 cluster bacterium JH702]MDG0868637.1 hypothetical protein [SAR202 cluster bacterium JH639]WFG35270.1 hypothetical protein GKN94_06040 [SAR202 cluster bacterium JH545]WFG39220.1 hypothetical protein GKO48_06170 [SAR202 cluster bacterium JH1073]